VVIQIEAAVDHRPDRAVRLREADFPEDAQPDERSDR
jgi:hypothetical protein